jgi:quinol monooxygenase YgiN
MRKNEIDLSRRALVAGGFAGGILASLPARSQTRSPAMEATTIRVDDAVTTLVNVFTVDPANQPKVLAIFEEGIETLFSKMPGWISTNLLKGRSERQIIIYSQWRDAKDIDAFRQDPRMKAYFERLAALGKQEAFTCDVSYSLHA